MKKLSMVCSLMLVLGLMSSPALAQNFELTADPLCPGNGNTTEVELWVKSMPCSNMKAFGACVLYDTTYLSIDTTADIVFDSCITAFGAPVKYEPDAGCIRIGGAQGTGTTCMATTGDYLIGTLTFTQIADVSGIARTPVVASVACGSSSCSSDPFTGFVGCEAGNQLPTDGSVDICSKVCVLNITPGDTTCSSEETIDYDPVFNATNCPSATHVFSIDTSVNPCTGGTINASSGLFTAPTVTTGSVICTVCVEDTVNTDACIETGADCCSDVTVYPAGACATKIYKGGTCANADEIIYNRPGRRGLALSCCEELELCVCSSCDCGDTFTWEVIAASAGGATTDLSLTPTVGKSTVVDVVVCRDVLVTYTIQVTDCFGQTDSITIDVGKAVVGIGDTNANPNTQTTDVSLLLDNPEHHIKAMTVEICSCLQDDCASVSPCDDSYCLGNTNQTDCEAVNVCKWDDAAAQCVLGWCEEVGGQCIAVDNMVCTECVIDEGRSPGFICSANELENGCCRVVLYTTEPDDLIQQGSGAVARIKYDITDANSKDCLCLFPYERELFDQFNECVCAAGEAGEICFYICGDIYPQDCYECTSCGDGVVDLFDILEAVDILLGKQTATACQELHGDVPNGMPPYCGDPAGVNPPNCETDGEITLGDVLVIIDKALGKMNCCDYCDYGLIY